MRKFLILFVLLALESSCDNSNDDCFLYSAHIEEICGDITTITIYSISKNEYDFLRTQVDSSVPCVMVIFKDINNNSVEGYLKEIGSITCQPAYQ